MEVNIVMPNSEIVETARGESKVTYRNQPVFCRLCKADHVGRCPIREKEEAERNEEDRLHQPKVKTLLVGDSNKLPLPQRVLRQEPKLDMLQMS